MTSSGSTTSPSESGDAEDLRGRARAFFKAWRAGLRHWNAERAAELYEELEQLAARAELRRLAELRLDQGLVAPHPASPKPVPVELHRHRPGA